MSYPQVNLFFHTWDAFFEGSLGFNWVSTDGVKLNSYLSCRKIVSFQIAWQMILGRLGSQFTHVHIHQICHQSVLQIQQHSKDLTIILPSQKPCVMQIKSSLLICLGRMDIIVWKNFSILSPKLVLEYAEDILNDSRLKNCAKCKGGWCKSVCVERFEIWVKKGFFG